MLNGSILKFHPTKAFKTKCMNKTATLRTTQYSTAYIFFFDYAEKLFWYNDT